MKYKLAFSIVLPILLLTSSSESNGIHNNPLNNSTPPASKQKSTSIDRLSKVHYENLDDLILRADNILIGQVSGIGEFKGSPKYEVEVKENLAGSSDSVIDLYDSSDEYHIGDELLLFLSYFASEYYPRPVYTTIGGKSTHVIRDGKAIGLEKYGNGREMNELREYIVSNSPNRPEKSLAHNELPYQVVDEPESIAYLAQHSTFITRLVPKRVIDQNEYVTLVEVEIVEQLKGGLTETKILLPAYIEIGKEYVVCLKEREDLTLTLTTRNGSVLSEQEKDDQRELIEQIAN